MAEAFQTDRVDGEDLISPLEPSLFSSSSLLKHGLHEDWHVPVWRTKPSHDRETEAAVALLHQLDVHLLVDLVVLPVDDQAHSVRRLPQRVQGKAVSDTPQVLPHDL